MLRFRPLYAFFPILVAASACAVAPGNQDEARGEATSAIATLSPARIAELKAAVRGLALENIDRSDNLPTVRAQLDPLVAELASTFESLPVSDKLPIVKGAWRQIWTDFPYPSMGAIQMDPRQVYQVVSGDGYYYNLGNNKALGLLPLTGVLRGAYEPSGSQLTIRFTRVGFRFGFLDTRTELTTLATRIEGGGAYVLDIPGGGKAPNGPVGISGTLRTLYADADIRIERGTQDDFKDASGAVVRPGVTDGIFILDRVSLPVAR